MRVLIVEDHHYLGAAIRDELVSYGHAADWVRALAEARDAIDAVDFELILLDLTLPDGEGMDLLRDLRDRGNSVPVIIATARDQIGVRVEGLNAGADDFVIKPFDLTELVARLTAVKRRSSASPLPTFRGDRVVIDLGRRTALFDGRPTTLTAREWALLDLLVRHRRSVVTKEDIETSMYEFGAEVESNTVEVYVSRLRKKLGRDFVKTIRGVGYVVEQ